MIALFALAVLLAGIGIESGIFVAGDHARLGACYPAITPAMAGLGELSPGILPDPVSSGLA